MKTRVTKIFTVFLALTMLLGCFAIPSVSAAQSEDSFEEILASLTAASYADYIVGVQQDGATQGKTEIPVDIFKYTESDMLYDDTVTVEKNIPDIDGQQIDLLVLPSSGNVTWTVNISEENAGLYGIRIEYYPLDGTTSSIERKLFIDGKVPFDEARALSFSKVWKYNYTDKEGNIIYDEDGNKSFRVDAANNDIRATISQAPRFLTYECTDTDGFYDEAFRFYFKEGQRTISLVAGKESFAIKSITLYPVEKVPSLEDKKAEWLSQGATQAPAGSEIYLRAETPDYVSDSAVYPSTDRSSALNEPLEAFSQKINVIGASSYNTTGQWAEYVFEVSEDGIYNIVSRYKQSTLQGMFASRVIKIASSDGAYGYEDGTPSVPYAECYNARFNYANNWQIEAMNTNGEGTELEFYFKKGVTYTLRVEVGLGDMRTVLNTLEDSLTTINECYLEILKLTGADPDEYRDYGFRRIMPQTVAELGIQSDVLFAQADELERICGTTGSNIATLRTIANLLEKMEDEDEIAGNLSNLKSYIGTLGTWINTAKSQSITVDYYMIAPTDFNLPKSDANFFQNLWFEIQYFFTPADERGPKANANIFQTLWFELKSFVASFFVDYDAMGVTEESTAGTDRSISVWLAYGRDQSQIWKNLITNDFTVQSNIAVDLKLVAAGTLLPSVLAKQGPDAYIGLAAADVINYAIRGAVMSIEDQKGSEEEGIKSFSEVLGYDGYTTNVPVLDEDGNTVGYTTEYWNYIWADEEKTVKALDANGNPLTTPVSADTISFNAATMIPLTLEDNTGVTHVWGLPEQASLPMMFYRKDILAELGINVPKTWDDVLEAIPKLQANNMMIGLSYASAINMFLYQFGGNLWRYTDDKEYAGAAIGLDTDIALNSFQYCTRLYTDYSFPFAFDGPNRFRTGEIPILIADYVTTYNQLVVFATEIRGLWEFTSIPGTIRDDGTVNNDSIVTVTATVMLNGCKDKAATWEYMQWQARGDVQSRYGNEMVALVGPAAKYATANLQGIRELSWSASELSNMLKQFDNLAAIPNYPGSYIIARYTNFAFLAAYNDGKDAVNAMQDYIGIINQEITRKREEFDMKILKDGQTPEEARLEEQNNQ